MADAQASGACIRKDVRVQVPPRPPVRGHLASTDLPSIRAIGTCKTTPTQEEDVEPPTRWPLRETHLQNPSSEAVFFDEFLEPTNTKETDGEDDALTRDSDDAPHIMSAMATTSYALKHQANSLVANIRGRHARIAATTVERTHIQLADILPLFTPVHRSSLVRRELIPGRVAKKSRSISSFPIFL